MDSISFGTDGWRDQFDQGFTPQNVARVARAIARTFKDQGASGTKIVVGYDTRRDGAQMARLVAEVISVNGFEAEVSDTYCPTPALCWTVAQDEDAVGGIMVTASHNPAAYSGIKIRMSDGGASLQEFTDRVEEFLEDDTDINTDNSSVTERDIMTPYLEHLKSSVDAEAIRNANLTVVVDSLYGASRGHLAGLLKDLGVRVHELHSANVTDFDGMHPEPIAPWIDEALAAVSTHSADGAFISDGDADRLAAADEDGTYISPHVILAMVAYYLVKYREERGRVVSTLSASTLLSRLTKDLGLELTITPIGFKWIYHEMLKGDVLVGGEESGGIGLPAHVRERDALFISLMLVEMMAKTGKTLKEMVANLHRQYGSFSYKRDDMRITNDAISTFRQMLPTIDPADLLSEKPAVVDRRDGLYVEYSDGSWLLMRPSGTEPLVRLYAEAETEQRRDELLAAGHQVIEACK